MRKTKGKANILQVFFLLILIAATFLLLGPMKKEADRRAEIIKDQIISRIESELNVRIRYSSISPALLSAVTISDLEVEFPSGSFYADRLRVFYNPLKQIRGDKEDPARMISRILVSDGFLDLDIVKSEGVPDDRTGQGGNNFDFLPLLAGKTVILTNIRTDISIPGVNSAIGDVERMEMRYDGNSIRYSFSGSGSMTTPGIPALGLIQADLASRGRFSPEEASLNGRVDILSADSGLLALKPMSVDVTYVIGEGMVVRRIGDQKPIDFSATYSAGEWSMSGETENLLLSELIEPREGTNSYKPWFGSALDGVFSISGNPGDNIIDYDIDLYVTASREVEPKGLKARLLVSGDAESAEVEDFLLSAEWGAAAFHGTLLVKEIAPVGTLSLKLNEDLIGYPIAATFQTEYSHGALVATPVSVNAGDQVFEDFSFLLIREEQIVTASLLAIPEHPDDEGARRIVVDALLELGSNPVFHAFVTVNGLHSTIPARLAGVSNPDAVPFLSDSRMDIGAFIEANRDSWVLNLENASLTSTIDPENGVTFSGRVFPDRWAMDGLHIAWNDFVADGHLFAVSSGDGGIAEGTLLVGERIFPISGSWYPDGRMAFESSEGLGFNMGPRSASGRTLLVNASDFSVPLNDGELISNLDVRGRVVPDDWELFVNRADFALRRGESHIDFSAGGIISPGKVALTRLSVSDASGILDGNAVFDSASSGRYMNGRLILSSENDESYELVLFKDNDDWDLKLNINAAQLNRLSPDRLAGTVDVTASLLGELTDPTVSAVVSSHEGYLDRQPFKAQAKANLQSGSLRIQDMFYEHEGVSLSRGIVLFDMNKGSLRTTADLNATFNQVPVSSGFSFALDLEDEFSLMTIPSALDGNISGTLATRPVLWNTREHLPAFTFQFARNEGILTARTPDGKILDLKFDANTGELDVKSAAPLPVVARGGGTIREGILDLSFPKLALDPELINYVMVRDPILLEYHVVFQDGMFDGDLDIRGPANDPDLFGTIRAKDLKVDTPYTYSSIQPASTDILFDGNRITVERIEIPIGDGFAYGEGFIVLDRWSITEFDMVFGGGAGPRGEGVPIYYPLLGVTLDGFFTGEVNMTGNSQSYFLDGAFTFPSLKASLSAPMIPVNQRPEGKYPKPVYLNLDFITGNNVTFFLPNEQLKIVRATAAPNGVLNFNYSTDPRTMYLTGDLPIKSGNIYYFDRDFQLTEGDMRFNETISSFDPMLRFRAETRVRDDNNEDVAVALVYDAPVKSDFNPRVETIPSRSDIEILELFGQAVVPYGDSGEQDSNAVLLATGSVFAQAGIVQPFEEVLREGLNLDMVTLRTDIIENTLSEGLGRGDDPDLTTLGSGLGRYLDNTSLFAGKYIGDALFISGSVSANYFEEQRNKSVFGGLEFATSLTLEMETPFFNVAWSYSPDPAISRNFVEDNEISLKWQFSF